jgi:hypothetical protein
MLIHFKAQLLVDAVGPPSFLSSIFCEVYYREKDMVVCRALAFSRLAEPNYGTRKVPAYCKSMVLSRGHFGCFEVLMYSF